MLSLSQSVGYAIRALSCMEDPACAKAELVKDISHCAGVPHAYLTKIFAKLVRAGILTSKRGPGGGTTLARSAQEITLLEISSIIDGPDWNNHCLLGLADCSDERNCPTHAMWKKKRAQVNSELERITLAEVLAFEAQKHKGEAKLSTSPQTCCSKTPVSVVKPSPKTSKKKSS